MDLLLYTCAKKFEIKKILVALCQEDATNVL